MVYMICASTPEHSVAVLRDDPHDALVKIDEFADLGLTEVTVTTDAGRIVTRDDLARLTIREPLAA